MTLSQQMFSFEGRLNRMPYWLILIGTGIIIVVIQVAAIMASGGAAPAPGEVPELGGLAGIVVVVTSLVSFWINIAVIAKRFHDRDKSGWWTLIILIPLIGALWILIECGFLRGTVGDNRFGSDPVAG